MYFKALSRFTIFLCMMTLSACSHKTLQLDAENIISKDDLLRGDILLGEDAEKINLPDEDILYINEKARSLLNYYVPDNYNDHMKVNLLMKAVLGRGAMSLRYDVDKTHTAQGAFESREANCLGFSYLFVSMARELGLKARFQEVYIPPQWTSAKEKVYYFSRHVNVRVDIPQTGASYIIDIDRASVKPHYRVKMLSDRHAKALYYNNVAMEYLTKEETADAFRYLIKALKMAPEESAIWSNLGVLYRLNDLPKYAEKAYQIALDYGKSTQSVLNNLSTLYDHIGNMEKAQYYAALAKRHQMKNPYYRYHRAQEAYAEGDYKTTLDHLRAAVKKKTNEYKFHQLLAETYTKLGMEPQAHKASSKAEKLRLN